MNRLKRLMSAAAAIAGCALTAFADTGYSHLYEWLESDGTQVIDLGVKPESDTMVFLTFDLLNTKERRLFGAHNGTDGVLLGVKGNWMARPKFENTYTSASGAVGRPYTFRIQIATPYISNGGYQFENHTLSQRYGTMTTAPSDYTYYVFGSNKAGEIEGKAALRLYSAVIYASDWHVLHDFRPASKNGTLGLVDRVTGEFRGNIAEGANAFTCGPEVETGAGSLTIATDPKNLPVALQPAAGTVDTLEIGATIPVSAPALPYATGDFTATCTGWTLYSWNADSGTWVEETDRENHSGAGTSFIYTHTGTASKLVWHYAVTNPSSDPGTTYRYVWNANGSDAAAGAGASWTMPYYSVKAALAAANAGDVILIGPGVYKLNGELTVNKSVTVRGAAGKGATELNGQDFCRCMTISGSATPSPVVEELTFRKGKSASQKDGGGVAVGYGTLRRCIVTDNAAGGRGGGLAISGSGLVSQCSVSSNRETICWGGVGVVMTSDNSILEHSIVFDNVNWNNGVAGAGGPGGGIYLASNKPTVRNCTIYGNCGTTGGGIYNNVGNNAKIHDCIVWGNLTTSDTSEGAPNWYGTGNKITNVFSSVAWGVTVGDRELVGNPDFKDAANGDFRLKATSLCCDSAWGVATVEQDYLGNPRVRGAKMDIGALESDPNEKAIAMVTAVDGTLDSAVLSCTAKGTGFDIEEATCYWTFDGRVPTADDYDEKGVYVSHTYGLGTVSVALTVVIGDETMTDVQQDIAFVYPSHTYVRETNPNAAAPYATWETAATDIQAAIDAAGDGSVVHVSNGTYHVTANVSVMKQLTVRSVEGWQKTTIDADKKCRCVYLGIAGAVVDGFTLTHGATPSNQDYGGGALVSAGTLKRCLVTDNQSPARGGGVAIYSQGCVSECLICTNRSTSSWGGPGVHMESGTIEHSIVFDNFNLDKDGNPTSGGDGGGILMFNGSPKVRNCTVYGNWAGLGGGIRNSAGSNGSVIDTIVWGNHVTGDSSAGAPNWNGDGTKMTNVFSTAQWGTVTVAEPEKFVGDPGFVDAANYDFHLKATSPCRDASWGQATVETDVYGAQRVQGDAMDVGAVENDPDVSSVSITYEKAGELDSCTVDFTANANGFDIAGATCYWTFDGRTPTAGDHDDEGLTVQKTYGTGTHSAALAVVHDGQTYEDSLVGFLTVAPSKVYVVVENEHAESPFDTWAKAATNVNDAVGVAAEKGTTIFVSNGIHHVSKAITVNKQLTLTSVNGPSVTAITTDGRDRILNQTINNSTVAGFTLTGGKSQSNANGGGVHIYGGVLTNCVVCGNRATGNSIGGGIFISGGVVSGCVISNNTIDANWWGGGVEQEGGVLENCLIAGNGNVSSSVNFSGGGIAVYQNGTIRNCTVVGNSAGPNGNGGGIYWRNSVGSVIDTIVWGNTGAAGMADLGGTPPSRVTNVCSSVAVGVNTSKSSLVGDPLFQDAANGNYRLRIQSPCRNAAWGKPTTSVDLDGKRRVVGRHLDLGCYECDLPVGTLILVR